MISKFYFLNINENYLLEVKNIMRLTFFGAAQSVTGSKHLITLENGKRILLDCGMTQGRGQDKFKNFPF